MDIRFVTSKSSEEWLDVKVEKGIEGSTQNIITGSLGGKGEYWRGKQLKKKNTPRKQNSYIIWPCVTFVI